MNVLSRHIRLDRAALEPLLAQAAADTLLLAADPAAAFERLLLPEGNLDLDEAVPLAYLRDGLRYLDQSKAFFQGFVDSLPTGNAPLDREFLRQRFDLYQAAHGKELPAVTQFVTEFSALLPLTEADLWGDGPAKPAAPAERPTPAAERLAPPTTPPPPPAPAPAKVSEEPTASPAPTPAAAPEPQPLAAPEALPPTDPASPTPGETRLYEKLKATQPAASHLASTLREAAHTGAAASLAERAAPQVGSLREAISINQRFSFINELFNGENQEYHAAIQHLDSLPTAEAAQAYVRQELATTHDWSRKEEHIAKLLKLIERKFAGA